MNLSEPLDLLLAIALCAIAWAVPEMWLVVGPLLIASVGSAWLIRITGGQP